MKYSHLLTMTITSNGFIVALDCIWLLDFNISQVTMQFAVIY